VILHEYQSGGKVKQKIAVLHHWQQKKPSYPILEAIDGNSKYGIQRSFKIFGRNG